MGVRPPCKCDSRLTPRRPPLPSAPCPMSQGLKALDFHYRLHASMFRTRRPRFIGRLRSAHFPTTLLNPTHLSRPADSAAFRNGARGSFWWRCNASVCTITNETHHRFNISKSRCSLSERVRLYLIPEPKEASSKSCSYQ